MAFTALDVKKLREMTNVGMMDCKAALAATDGDMDKAVDWLREKGLAKAAKKADRIAAEGVAYATVVNGIGVVIEVNSETDFAAKTDAFLDLVKNLATVVATENPADVEALKACKYPNSNLTVTEIMQEKVMSIGENMQIRRFDRFAENTSVAYVHAGGSHGVLVNLAVEGGIDATEVGKNVAMQIAAMKAEYWDKAQVPQADVDKEMAVQLSIMDNDPKMANKPAQVKEKIAQGKLAAFFKEKCLLQQEFVRSDLYKGDVEGYIADAAKKLGGKITFVNAIHYTKGEGIEKKVDDFAAEVAAQVAGAQK
ncbi:MAG: elongation factor Ts [Oscillospiraceae bacterium]|nr:elongation factor Ts [Oscillospiraceae bacterium]